MVSQFDKLYWLRIALGLLGGVSSFYLNQLGGDFSLLPATIFMLLYLASFYVARYTWLKDIKPEDTSKLFFNGLGGFIFLFLFTWILLFTFSNAR
jgi:hypothetical protein